MNRKFGLILILALLPLILGASSAEGEAASGGSNFLGKVVNFVILFGGLGYLMYKPVRAMLEKQSKDVETEIVAAESSRTSAEERLETARRRMDGLAGEVAKMKEEAEARGRREREAIAGLARDEADRIRRLTRLEIDARAQAGIRDVRAFVAARATGQARERIRKRLATEDQALLIDRSIERLSKLNEKPSSR
jgi:F0F1-type ATP synthase membrane subunit b/b'